MTKEEFVANYLKVNKAYIIENAESSPIERITLNLIESVYDLQQQIAHIQEQFSECVECGMTGGWHKISCDTHYE